MKNTSYVPAILLALAAGCSKDDGGPGGGTAGTPAVGFTYTLNGTVAPSQLSFTNQSQGATSYLWDFGDGTTSTDTDPVHVYTAAGNYAIKLIAFGEEQSATAGITVAIQAPYTSCRLQRIILESAPFTHGGGTAWDSTSGPDFKFKVLYRNTTQVLAVSNTVTDVTAPQLPLAFDISPPLAFPAFNQEYDVLLYDDDAPGPDELAGGYFFRLSDATTISYHYPDTMLLYQAGSDLRMNLVLEWGY